MSRIDVISSEPPCTIHRQKVKRQRVKSATKGQTTKGQNDKNIIWFESTLLLILFMDLICYTWI